MSLLPWLIAMGVANGIAVAFPGETRTDLMEPLPIGDVLKSVPGYKEEQE